MIPVLAAMPALAPPVVPLGLLLDRSLLSSPVFITLATMVGFNTVIYLGLTLAKFLPWPKQFRPSRVRSTLNKAGFMTVDEPPRIDPAPRASEDPLSAFEDLRAMLIRSLIPQAFGFFGVILFLSALAMALTIHGDSASLAASGFVVAGIYLALAQVTGHRRMPTRVNMWIWTLAATVTACLAIFVSALVDDLAPLAPVLVLICAAPAVSLAWRPALFLGAAVMISTVLAELRFDSYSSIIGLAIAGTALAFGYVLLRIRLESLELLAEERARAQVKATTDIPTGALTRNGLLTLVPHVTGPATRAGSQVCLVYVNVRDMAGINADYGVAYGDSVLASVREGMRSRIRMGDLLCRWEGDRFVVLGIGDRADASAMAERLVEGVRALGTDLGKRPITLAVGTSAADPRSSTLDELVRAAAADSRGASLS